MYLPITIILLLVLYFYFEENNTPITSKNEKYAIQSEPVLGFSEKTHWASYENTPIPKIPYVTHYDVIAPPKAAVEINCPECDNKWE